MGREGLRSKGSRGKWVGADNWEPPFFNSNKFIINLGKSGNRRQRVGIAHKMGLLRKFSTIYGSNEIKARA